KPLGIPYSRMFGGAWGSSGDRVGCDSVRHFANGMPPLQRLTQSLFQLPAIGSADSRSRTVFQDRFKFAMRDRLQVQDAFDIDDSRTMDADKTNGIEPGSKLAQRGPV